MQDITTSQKMYYYRLLKPGGNCIHLTMQANLQLQSLIYRRKQIWKIRTDLSFYNNHCKRKY